MLSKQEGSVDPLAHPPVVPPVLETPHLHALLKHVDAAGRAHWAADPHLHVPEVQVPQQVLHAGLQTAARKKDWSTKISLRSFSSNFIYTIYADS